MKWHKTIFVYTKKHSWVNYFYCNGITNYFQVIVIDSNYQLLSSNCNWPQNTNYSISSITISNHTFPYSRAIYSNRSSDSRRPAQKGVYHCFPFFYSRSASFIHKHGHNTSHTPFLSDLNKEMYVDSTQPDPKIIEFLCFAINFL